jgi:outer membrane murein-binding lipoprotein Lpp
MKSQEIQERYQVLCARRDALIEEKDGAQSTLCRAREALIEGRPDAAASVTAAQSTYTALNEAVEALAPQIEALRRELEAAQSGEARASVLDRLEHLATRGQNHLAEMERARAEAAIALEPFVDRMVSAIDGLSQTRRDFLNTAREEAPGITSSRKRAEEQGTAGAVNALIEELRHRVPDLEAVSVQWVGTPQGAFDKEYPFGRPWPEAGPHSAAVTLAFEQALGARAAEAAKADRAAKV